MAPVKNTLDIQNTEIDPDVIYIVKFIIYFIAAIQDYVLTIFQSLCLASDINSLILHNCLLLFMTIFQILSLREVKPMWNQACPTLK